MLLDDGNMETCCAITTTIDVEWIRTTFVFTTEGIRSIGVDEFVMSEIVANESVC